MPVTYVTYAQLYEDVKLLADAIRLDTEVINNLAGVCGVPRSGMVPATMLANFLHCELFAWTGEERVYLKPGNRLRPVSSGGWTIVLDDSQYTGAGMERVRQGMDPIISEFVKYAAVYYDPEQGPKWLSYCGRGIPPRRYFEWNLMQHPDLPTFMCDLDGVICYDPTAFDDDGPLYEASLKHARPLHLPHLPVGSICTHRIERWLDVTKDWLARHKVQWMDRIYMSPYKTAQARREAGRYGRWKGEVYRDAKETLFIESSDEQAHIIAEVSNKPVICISSGKVYQ